MAKYLDEVGLRRVWSYMKSYVDYKLGTADKLTTARAIDGVAFDGTANVSHYAACSTSGSTAAKTCSITGFSLVTGARVMVRFANANTANHPTLNVNSTGAKYIYYKSTYIPKDGIKTGTVLELVYSGSYWYVVGDLTGYLTDTLTSPVSLYTSATGIYADALTTWAYTTISGLSDWKEVRMWIEVGDGMRGYCIFNRSHNEICASGYASAAYNGVMRVMCDFTNNRVGIYVSNKAGWGFASLRVLSVEGLVRNT